MKKYFSSDFLLILIFVVVIRFALAFFPGMLIDMNNWLAWSNTLVVEGITKFYHLPIWTDYTPGFLYYLWAAGSVFKVLGGSLTEFWVKVPIILADLCAGYLIYSVLRKKSEKLGIIGFLALVFHPGLLFSDSIFGQTDGLLAFFVLLAAYFIAEKKNLVMAWIAWGIAILIKPQAISVFPIFILYCLKNFPTKRVIYGLIAGFITVIAIGYPFFHSNPIFGLPELMIKMNRESTFTSFMAFNFWAWIPGMFIQDSTTFLGLSYYRWGMLAWAVAVILIAIRYLKGESSKISFYQAAGLSSMAFFLFMTRLHERYILYAFPLLLLAALFAKSKTWLLIYFFTGVLSLLNIYYPYAYYTPDSSISSPKIVVFIASIVPWISVSYLGAFGLLLVGKKIHWIENFHLNFTNFKLRFTLPTKTEKFKENKVITSRWKLILLGILAFAFISRVWNLGFPNTYYFDEVYHAFTAEAYARNDPKGYEWWNTPPTGFAYEWLHPPLAKLVQAGSIKIFGDKPFAWRFPGVIFAVGTIFVLFLIGRDLFGSVSIGLMAGFLYTVDGLSFTQSRITMNDIYLAFFLTLAFYLLWKYLQVRESGKEGTKRLLLLGLVIGLACATKWTGFYCIGMAGSIWFVYLLRSNRRKDVGYMLRQIVLGGVSFVLIPFAVYVLSYSQFWLQGHTTTQFIELHKQIWWYQTNLKATHPYQSTALTWPLLIRPVYLYTSNEVNGMVARIYNLGNPAVFWGGVVAVMMAFYYSFIDKNKRLALVIFAYLIFFVPWIASPRCMFLYHYLPAVPFMCILIGYVLRRLPKAYAFCFLTLALLLFIYFYPHWAGINIPLWLDKSYYWFPSWR